MTSEIARAVADGRRAVIPNRCGPGMASTRPTDTVRPRHALALLANAEFRAVWLIGALTGVVRWLELLAFGVFVYDLSQSALMVSLVSLLRMLPLALFGIVTGALVEHLGAKRTLVLGLAAMLTVAAGMLAIAWFGQITVWHLALAAFLGGLFWTTDLPARRTMLGTIAGSERVAQAMALDSATSNATRALGPALGGLALAGIGLKGVLLFGVAGYALSLLLLLRVPEIAASAIAGRLPGVWRGIRDGLRYAAGNREMAGALAVTIIFNVWAFPYTAMIPVIGREVLGLGPFPVGLIMSAEGSGALLGALYLTAAARVELYRRYYFFGCLACLAMILALAGSPGAWSAGLSVLIAGIGAGFFSTMQATLIFTLAPPELRSRLMGVLTVCIGTAPLGFAHVGLLADWLGPEPALIVIAAEGLLASLVAWLYWPEIR